VNTGASLINGFPVNAVLIMKKAKKFELRKTDFRVSFSLQPPSKRVDC
jgi:hypothetical protein